jgi:hypothetical protein
MIGLIFQIGDTVAPAVASMAVSPSKIRKSRTTLVTFTGSGTEWLSSSPILSNAGVSGLVVGSPSILNDTMFTVSVTTGESTGVITWTESQYGITVQQSVGSASAPIFLLQPGGPRRRGG